MDDCFTSALLAQFLAVQPEPEPEIKPMPAPPELVREQLQPETEHQCEAVRTLGIDRDRAVRHA